MTSCGEVAGLSRLFLRVTHVLGIYNLLGVKNRIPALGGQDGLALVLENERRVLPIKHQHIDLIAEGAAAVDDVRLQ
jgi:hypothetical protein